MNISVILEDQRTWIFCSLYIQLNRTWWEDSHCWVYFFGWFVVLNHPGNTYAIFLFASYDDYALVQLHQLKIFPVLNRPVKAKQAVLLWALPRFPHGLYKHSLVKSHYLWLFQAVFPGYLSSHTPRIFPDFRQRTTVRVLCNCNCQTYCYTREIQRVFWVLNWESGGGFLNIFFSMSGSEQQESSWWVKVLDAAFQETTEGKQNNLLDGRLSEIYCKGFSKGREKRRDLPGGLKCTTV